MNSRCHRTPIFIVVSIALLGCDQTPKNQEQIDFIVKIQKADSENNDLKIAALKGKDKSGGVAPSDINSRIKKSNSELWDILKNPQHTVTNWNANVSYLKRKGGDIIISSKYGNQSYDLIIFDTDSINIAEKLREDDKIQFSGNIGSERSATLFGATSSPEFLLYPTSVLTTHGEMKQSSREIGQRTSLNQEQSAKHEKQRQKQSEEEDLKDRIIDLCKSTLRSTLKYPESASFSWFKRNFIRRSENNWTYYDVLEAKNSFGGTLPSRFECDATVLNEQIEVSVRLLDGVE